MHSFLQHPGENRMQDWDRECGILHGKAERVNRAQAVCNPVRTPLRQCWNPVRMLHRIMCISFFPAQAHNLWDSNKIAPTMILHMLEQNMPILRWLSKINLSILFLDYFELWAEENEKWKPNFWEKDFHFPRFLVWNCVDLCWFCTVSSLTVRVWLQLVLKLEVDVDKDLKESKYVIGSWTTQMISSSVR